MREFLWTGAGAIARHTLAEIVAEDNKIRKVDGRVIVEVALVPAGEGSAEVIAEDDEIGEVYFAIQVGIGGKSISNYFTGCGQYPTSRYGSGQARG